MVTSILSSEVAEALAEADRLVAPWLIEGKDAWRKDRDGLPELDDLFTALARVRGQRIPQLRIEIDISHFRVLVSERDCREEYEAETLPEALLLMLRDDLRRTCVACCVRDGHDGRCVVLLAELAEDAAL